MRDTMAFNERNIDSRGLFNPLLPTEQKLQFMLWQREQEQGFLALRNAQSTSFFRDQVSGTAQVFGAFGCPQRSTKTAQAQGVEVPSRNFLHSSLPFLYQEKHPPPAAAAAAAEPSPQPQLTDCTTTNSNNTSQSAQASDLETADLENDMILKELEDAIQLIPTERKQAYLESLEACKENTPSFLFQFLRRGDYNVWDAAERLVRYWQFRKEIFMERAFLPIILTGDGALTAEDVLQLKAGFPMMLPDTKSGETVLFFDRAQWLPNVTCVQKLRCVFYMAHVAALQIKKTQTEGIVVITLVSQPRWREIDSQYTKTVLWMGENVLPVKVRYHLMNFPPSARRRFWLQDHLYDIICSIARHGVTPENVVVHFERQKGELLDALLDLGLKREGIPTVLGGTWRYSECMKWCKHQYYLESQKFGKGVTFDVLLSSGMSDKDGVGGPNGIDQQKSIQRKRARTSGRKPGTASGGACAIKSAKRQDDEENKRRIREMNLIHSRRKRERRQAEMQDIVEERDELLGEQESHLAEHARLTSLLDQANQWIQAASLKADARYT